MTWYLEALQKYAVFNGRATRSEYWWFYICNMIIAVALAAVDIFVGGAAETGMGFLSGLYSLFILVPSIAVTVRRLHDTNHSGWWMFISLVPLLGSLWLTVWLLQDSVRSSQFGSTEISPAKAA